MTVVVWDKLPLVPVTITATLPLELNVQLNVADPEPVTLVGDTVHAALLADKLTTPVNPFTPVTVIVEVPAAFTFTLTDVGLALIVKSWTV